jgi:GH25 family lysozyme M1 (1,4-beta-N-acetylmuramidase)
MADLLLADISEFQESVDADAYIRGGHGVIICRVHNGYRGDYKALAGRIAYLRSKPFVALGWYQYLVPDRDARQQAHEFMGVIGSLRANEFPVLDLEKGAGEQTQRAEQWFTVVDPWAGFDASLYSGLGFLVTQLGGVGRWGRRPLWIADYVDYRPTARNEPSAATWWQYTDRATFPGIPGAVDGSIWHGTAHEFLERVRPGGASTIPTPPEGTVALAVATMKDGRFEVFVEDKGGQIWHAWQSKEGGWAGAKTGQNAAWYSLGTPGGKK